MKNVRKKTISANAFDKKYYRTGSYKDYKKIAGEWTGIVAKRVRKSFRDIHAPRVLDVGCAHGYLLAALQETGCEVRGMEYSSHAIRNAEKGVKGSIRKGSILKKDTFKENAFDAVVCLNVAEYISEADMPKGIRNLVRWTNGLIFFTTCFTHSRYASQKHSPDPFRITVKTQKQWRELFKTCGAAYVKKFYDGGGGDVLIFKKRKNK